MKSKVDFILYKNKKMSRTHGRLLWVDGFRSVKSDVAPMNYLDVEISVKRRHIKPKGIIGEKKSRRQPREDNIAEKNAISDSNTRTLKALMIKVGSSEKLRSNNPETKE